MGGEEDCEELSLELSIGGKYGKAENLREKARDENVQCEEISRCDFSGFLETMDPQRRREIQALRRQEARRKREGKVKKSRGMNVDVDKLFLEAHKFQGRVRDREIREKESFLGGESRQNGEVGEELRLSLFSEKKQKRENGWLYPKVQLVSMNSSDSKNSDIGVKSLEQCASAVSDYHSMSHKGGSSSSSDTGSQSQPRAVVEQMGGHDSSASSSGGGVNTGGGGGLPRMPCVSAIGNGPNGRRVTGFLYRYDKGTEVSIVCVCHGSSFSPAEFVRHAGGVDVAHPLRHITVVPPSVVILNDKY